MSDNDAERLHYVTTLFRTTLEIDAATRHVVQRIDAARRLQGQLKERDRLTALSAEQQQQQRQLLEEQGQLAEQFVEQEREWEERVESLEETMGMVRKTSLLKDTDDVVNATEYETDVMKKSTTKSEIENALELADQIVRDDELGDFEVIHVLAGSLVNETEFEFVEEEVTREEGVDDVEESVDEYGNTALHIAAEGGRLEHVQELLRRGVNINVTNNDRETPLYLSSKHGYLAVVKYLIQKGADVKAVNKDGDTTTHWPAWSGKLEVVRYLIESGAEYNEANIGGNTPLHWAASTGRLEIVRLLVGLGCDVNAVNKARRSPLQLAAVNGSVDVVKYLVEFGVEVTRDVDGIPLMHLAAGCGQLEVVRYLAEVGGDVGEEGRDGKTLLYWAMWSGEVDVVRYLVEKGATVKEGEAAQVMGIAGKWAMEEYLREVGIVKGDESSGTEWE